MTINYPTPAVRDAWADTAVPWNGTTGDIADPGNAYIAAGWLSSSTPPPRQYFNFALNWVGSAVRYFMQNGVVDWQAGELYQSGSVVVYNGFVYQCKVNNTTGTIPVVNSATWDRLVGYALLSDLTSYVTAAQLAIDLAVYAALNSPSFTGVPLAPTAGAGTSNNQIATTAFVQNAIANIGIGGYLTVAAAAATYLTIANAAATYLTQANAQGFGAGKLPAGIYRNSLGSGVVTIQQGGTPSGGQPGDIFLIY